MPGTSCAEAIEIWQGYNPDSPVKEATKVLLCGLAPPIEKMDEALHQLVNVKQLSLSTNAIEKMIPLAPLRNLEILSLGRNHIKKIEGLEAVSATLRELWLSYNQINTLDGLDSCLRLEVLFMSNNKIGEDSRGKPSIEGGWRELDKLTCLPELKNVLFVGNPIYQDLTKKDILEKVTTRLPALKNNQGKVDGVKLDVALSQKGEQAMADLFDMMDKNKNGVLEPTEQQDAMKNIHSMLLPETRWAWEGMDTNRDGKISKDEWHEGMRAIAKEVGEEVLLACIVRAWPDHPLACAGEHDAFGNELEDTEKITGMAPARALLSGP
jgi:dynein light chain 1